ncbi:MAG: hypothetical protein KC503_33415 [Myxococcales bacterium]|nr:hypothetical protein [Myxococcales bacterium]
MIDLDLLQQTDPIEWPETATEALIAVLGTPTERDDDELMLAAQLVTVGGVLNDVTAAALCALLDDEGLADEVRAQAALALGPALQEFDEEGEWDFGEDAVLSVETFRLACDTLMEIFADEDQPPLLRRRALEAAVRAPQDWHAEAIANAFAHDDHDWQLTAVFCMRWVPGFETEILEALDSESDLLRGEALLAAGAWEIEAAWPVIEALLVAEDTEKDLRLAAIEAAVGMPTDDADAIFAELVDHHDEEIAAAAADAMMMIAAMAGELEELEEEL